MRDYHGIIFAYSAAPELREKFPNHCRRVEDVLRTL